MSKLSKGLIGIIAAITIAGCSDHKKVYPRTDSVLSKNMITVAEPYSDVFYIDMNDDYSKDAFGDAKGTYPGIQRIGIKLDSVELKDYRTCRIKIDLCDFSTEQYIKQTFKDVKYGESFSFYSSYNGPVFNPGAYFLAKDLSTPSSTVKLSKDDEVTYRAIDTLEVFPSLHNKPYKSVASWHSNHAISPRNENGEYMHLFYTNNYEISDNFNGERRNRDIINASNRKNFQEFVKLVYSKTNNEAMK